MLEFDKNSYKESIVFMVAKSYRLLNKVLDSRFDQTVHNVTPEQWPILNCLWIENGLNQQSIADYCDKNKASITFLLDRLEKKKMIIRKVDKRDKRNKMIHLTPRGKKIQDELLVIASNTFDIALNGITMEDLNTCRCVLNKLIDNLQDYNRQRKELEA